MSLNDHFVDEDHADGLTPYLVQTTVHSPTLKKAPRDKKRRPPLPLCVVVVPVLFAVVWAAAFGQVLAPISKDARSFTSGFTNPMRVVPVKAAAGKSRGRR